MQAASGWRRGSSLYSLILRQTLRLQALAILVGLALPALAVIPLHLQERMIDEAIPARDLDLVAWLGVLLGLAVLLRGALKLAVVYLRGWISAIVARVLRTALVDAQRHREENRARRSLGVVTSILAGEVQPLGAFAAEALNTPIIQGGTLIGVAGYMVATDWRLAAIGIGSLALEGTVTPILQHHINRLTERRIRTLRTVGAEMIEAADPAEHRHVVRGLGQIRQAYRILLRMNLLKGLLKTLRNLIDHAADIAIIAVGAGLVIEGEIGVGVIVAFLSGLREVRGPWGELVSFYRRVADATVKYRLVRRAMNGDAEQIAAAMAPRLPTAAPVRGRLD